MAKIFEYHKSYATIFRLIKDLTSINLLKWKWITFKAEKRADGKYYLSGIVEDKGKYFLSK